MRPDDPSLRLRLTGRAEPPAPRGGVLAIRAWSEHGHSPGAQMTSTVDIVAADPRTPAAAGADDVCAAVAAWLDAVLAAGRAAGPTPPAGLAVMPR